MVKEFTEMSNMINSAMSYINSNHSFMVSINDKSIEECTIYTNTNPKSMDALTVAMFVCIGGNKKINISYGDLASCSSDGSCLVINMPTLLGITSIRIFAYKRVNFE